MTVICCNSVICTLPRLTSSYFACVSGSTGVDGSPPFSGAFLGASRSASATAVLARADARDFEGPELFLREGDFAEDDFADAVFEEEDFEDVLRERLVLPAIEIKPPKGGYETALRCGLGLIVCLGSLLFEFVTAWIRDCLDSRMGVCDSDLSVIPAHWFLEVPAFVCPCITIDSADGSVY